MAESMGMSRMSMSDVASKALAMRNAALDHITKLESPVRKFAWSTVRGLSTFSFAFVNGRFANPKAGGMVGYDAIAAFLFFGASTVTHFVGKGNAIVHLAGEGAHAIGDGALGSYLAKLGAGVGLDARTKALATATPATATAPATAGYGGRYRDMHRGSRTSGALSAQEAALYTG